MSDYIIEAKVKEKIGRITPIVDNIKGDANQVISVLVSKYSGKSKKKSLSRRLELVFDIAGKGMDSWSNNKR